MRGHCGVVIDQRRSTSESGSFKARPRPMSTFNLPCCTNTRLQTISPGLLTPLIVPPPSRKYIGCWRSLVASSYARAKWSGGTEPEISNTHTKSLLAIDYKVFSVANIVESRLGGESVLTPDTVRDQGIKAGAFVGLVEMGQSKIFEQNSLSLRILYWRPVDIVQ